MPDLELSNQAQAWIQDLLTWIGFGTLVGLAAKAIMPGRDPGGSLATLLMGIGGSIVGCGTLAYFYDGRRISPITPLGFLVATAGAFVLLFFYKLLSGQLFLEGEQRRPRAPSAPRRVRRTAPRETVAQFDE